MNETYPTQECEATLETIERSLAGSLASDEQRSMQVHVAACDFCSEALENATIVHATFQETGAPVCPDHVVESILEEVERDAVVPLRSPAPRRSGMPAWMTGAIAAALVLMAVIVPNRDPSEPPVSSEPTMAEIQMAAEEMAYAFSLVSGALSRTSGIIDEHVRGGMSDPLIKSLERGGIQRNAPKPSAEPQDHSELEAPRGETQTALASSADPNPWS